MDRKVRPQQVGHGANENVGCHVVCVVPPHELEVVDVSEVGGKTEVAPESNSVLEARTVESKYAQRRIIKPIHDVGSRSEVVHAFGKDEIAGMKDSGAEPAEHAEVTEPAIIRRERVVFR